MGFAEIITDTIKKAESAKTENNFDYTENGILFCGKCRTAKQCNVTIFGVTKTVPCICKCEKEKREAEEKKKKQAERIANFRRIGFADVEMQKWTFANDDRKNEKLTRIAENYVKYFQENGRKSKGLLLFGNVGSGKTYAAACIANALIDAGHSVCMTNFSRIGNTVQGLFDGRQAYYDGFNKFDLLIIDDLSAERKTEYMQEIVFNVIDARYRAGLPIIITTNLTADELKKPDEIKNQRTFSRLFEMCYVKEVKYHDRRKQKCADEFYGLREILEG